MLRTKELQSKYFFLALCGVPILASVYYHQTGYTSIALCPVKTLTGIPCPSCGMTRGFICIVGGDLECAFSENLFSPVVFVGFLVTVVHLFLEILLHRKIDTVYTRLLNHRLVILALVVGICVYNFIRLIPLYYSGELAASFLSSPIGKMISP